MFGYNGFASLPTKKSYQELWENSKIEKDSVAGNRTQVFRVRAEYPNRLDYNG